jgi:hypothetical protein
MMMKQLPPISELKFHFHYDPNTGIFSRYTYRTVFGQKVRNPDAPLKPAGSLNGAGYIEIKINKRVYSAHRLAWLYMTGEDPVLGVDHVNRDKTDNRWGNLRLATDMENSANSIRKGFRLKDGKYEARIRHNGRETYLGRFDCPLMAHLAYQDAHKELYREFSPF